MQIIFTTHAAITVWGIVGASTERSTDYRKGESIALHSWFIDEILYAPLSALIRSSIAVFLLRIATVKLHRMIIYGSLIVTWVLSLAYLFIMLFQCWPVSHFYEQVVGQAGTCMNQNVVPIATIVHSVISALTDCLLVGANLLAVPMGCPRRKVHQLRSATGVAARGNTVECEAQQEDEDWHRGPSQFGYSGRDRIGHPDPLRQVRTHFFSRLP